MDLLTNNLAESLFIIGLILLVVEVVVLGFSTFVLLFVGVAAIATSILLYIGLVPDNVLSAFLCTGVITLIAAALLWQPLKRMQSDVSPKKAQGDLVGHQFILQESVSSTAPVTYHYSGVNWKLICAEPIEAGARVEVIDAEVGAFHIKVVES